MRRLSKRWARQSEWNPSGREGLVTQAATTVTQQHTRYPPKDHRKGYRVERRSTIDQERRDKSLPLIGIPDGGVVLFLQCRPVGNFGRGIDGWIGNGLRSHATQFSTVEKT